MSAERDFYYRAMEALREAEDETRKKWGACGLKLFGSNGPYYELLGALSGIQTAKDALSDAYDDLRRERSEQEALEQRIREIVREEVHGGSA